MIAPTKTSPNAFSSTADFGNNSSIDLTYKFDAMGRRVIRDDGTTATIYVQAGQQTIAAYTAGTAAYNLRTVKAYLMREDFNRFWTFTSPTWASKFLRALPGDQIYTQVSLKKLLVAHRKTHPAEQPEPPAIPDRAPPPAP